MTAATFDTLLERIEAGETLSASEIHELAHTPDILSLGVLADGHRRRLHGTRVTFVRVAESPFDRAFSDGAPPSAGELRITGSPPNLAAAVSAVQAVRAVGQGRPISGFSWADAERWSSESPHALAELRAAGLDAVAHVPIDGLADPAAAIEKLAGAGFERLRLLVEKAAADSRTGLLLRVGDLQRACSCIHA